MGGARRVNTGKRILAVDDEPGILAAVSSFLESRGYTVLTAQTGTQALELLERGSVSLLLLDLMLPDLSGEEVCARVRRFSRVPIIMLTAKTGEQDLLDGLALGADDYIAKPFSLKALHARIEAVLRRAGGDFAPLSARSVWGDGDLILDFERNEVRKGGQPVPLTLSERKILAALAGHPGRVFTREALIEAAFGSDFDGYDRVIDTHIKNLRQKIEDQPRQPVYLRTVHGLGYRFGGGGHGPGA